MNISLENIKDFGEPIDFDSIQRFFIDENGSSPTLEHNDQILMFKNEASKFLWDFEHKLVMEARPKFYKNVSSFNSNNLTVSEIKKYLYNLSIPFSSWVFIAEQPSLGFMMTWKMIIKYNIGIFGDDDYQQIWDKTLNWKLEYNHGIFTYGVDLIYNSHVEADKILNAANEMKSRNY
jgi:hypothetical protein